MEALIKLARTTYRERITDEVIMRSEEYKNALNALQPSEWVKVEDRLPEENEWYQLSNGKDVHLLPHQYIKSQESWLAYGEARFSDFEIRYYRLIDLTPPNR